MTAEAAPAPRDVTAEAVPEGLSESEVLARRAAGQGNIVPSGTGRTYGRIVRDNVFNFINNVLFALGITLVALGRYLDALVSVGVVLANTVVSLYQEIRAKRMLDRIAVLTRPRATAVRAGVRREVDPSEIVLGDVLELEPGDQIVVDGQMVGRGRMEVDESMLTGESDAVTKASGDPLFSGSFVVNGGGLMEVQKVGMESFAARIAAGAQAFRRVRTPLQEQVNLVIRALLLMVVYFEILVIVKALVEDTAFVETVRMSTVIVALVPNGLILAIALAYALGAVRMAGKGALIQQSNAVESLSHVDVLCTDKTGTLTTNNIKMDELLPLGDGARPEAAARIGGILGDYAASTMAGNRTTEAFLDAYGGTARAVREEVLFSSARKWSALAFDDPDLPGVYVLGAPEIVAPYLEPADGPDGHAAEWTAAGLRVLLLAHKAVLDGPLNGPDGKAELPEDLQPLALISLRDELRPLARETLEGFSAAGVQLKVISGDNPQTVAALAVQAGFPADLRVVSGKELEGLGQGQLADIADEATIFGRVTPQQKEELVDALRSRGRYVAMVGDGVNDVISLKRANLGIAMQSGSQAARGVADMVLLDDSFGSLPYAFQEGQRIQNGMADILKIFMVRIFSKVLIIASVVAVGGFPFSPRQGSMLSFFTAGLPTLALAAWARPGAPERGSLMGRLVRFTLPATLLQSLMALGVYLLYLIPRENDFMLANPLATRAEALQYALPPAQTATAIFAALCGLLMILFTVPPSKFWTGGSPLRGDMRPAWLTLGLFVFFAVVLAVPLGRTLFELTALPFYEYLLIAAGAAVWALLTRLVWRTRLLDRFFGAHEPGASG